MWNTDAPACGGNNEWWGFRHDDRSTGVYGNDTRAPGPVRDLSVTALASVTGGGTIASGLGIANFGLNARYTSGSAQGSLLFDDKANGVRVKSQTVSTLTSARSVSLRWTAPGGDGYCGQADHYEIRAATFPITGANWKNAQLLGTMPAAPVGTREQFAVPAPAPGTYYFAVRAVDGAGNIAAVSKTAPPVALADIAPGTAVIRGIGSVNGSDGHQFEVTVTDAGEPGAGADRFGIRLDTGYSAGGTLRGGNIQVGATSDTAPSNDTVLTWTSLFTTDDVLFLLQRSAPSPTG